MNKNEIYKIYGKNYKEMTKTLLQHSDLIHQIPDGARVGIKPNLVTPTPAEYGATTHPEVVAGIVEYLQEHGIFNPVIMEGSWIGDKTSEAYEYCGYRQLCEMYDIKFIDAQQSKSTLVDCQGMKLKICDCVNSVDFMINVPVLKGHGQTKITCALKNMKGLIPNTEKRHFHTMGLHKPIAHLSKGIRQDFIVVDHICGDLELEDGGNPIEKNCIMTAMDPVLLDSYVCHLLGYETDEVEYIPLAEKLGAGSTDLSSCQIQVFDQDKVYSFMAEEQDPFEECWSRSDDILEVSYAIEDADSCSACYASLAPAILQIKREGNYEKLLAKLNGKICIGQGFSGKNGKFGVGNCCRLFERNIPGCPPEEEDVYDALMQFIME
ncbi:MAG: DUF362 domain-containing protein [Eubacteriales bacterium]|nr:DUF362 domain-containing protein [Eubacteriales bacterium]